jgi:hypothetical protein
MSQATMNDAATRSMGKPCIEGDPDRFRSVLERDGLVTRTLFPEVPPRVEYEATELGRTLTEPVLRLAMWAAGPQAAIIANREAFDSED